VFSDVLEMRLRGMVSLSAEQRAALQSHYDLLVKWNKVLNLTTLRRVEDVVERHYCESVFLACRLPEGTLSVADIGSGAGFPGIPVAVMRPESSMTLIESHQRKAVFLREASRSLRNVRVLAKRAEDVEEGFDWLMSRAVSGDDLSRVALGLAGNLAVLGAEAAPFKVDNISWADPIRLPWGARRYLWFGSRVSRGT
jgi:16S rRNA (guanine527-N7)-methyltransferase